MSQDLVRNIGEGKKERLYYIDHLKVFLTVLVTVHHVGQAYGPTGGFWQYKSSMGESIQWLGSFFPVNASFFMGLFFMISGYFISQSYERKGSKNFIKDRLIRYGIPLLFIFLIIQPLEMYFYYALYSGNVPLSFPEYLRDVYFGIGTKPVGFIDAVGWPEMNFGHTWFIEHLLIYSLIYCLIREKFNHKESQRSQYAFGFLHIIGIALLVGITSTVVRIWYPIDEWIGILGFIQTEVAHLPQYIILFITGILAFKNDWFNRVDKRVGYLSLGLGAFLGVLVYLRPVLSSSMVNMMYNTWGFYESCMGVLICWGLIVLFRERFYKTSPFKKTLANNSYAAYIIHYPMVLCVQYSFDGVGVFGEVGKFLVVSLISVLLTYIVSFYIRKIPQVRRIL